jgi:nicotinate phosphoribosyltransferase
MIIESALDNDQYKFSMMQAVLHQHPAATAEYLFKCRTPNVDFRPYVGDIIKNINKMCNQIRFTDKDIEYIGDLGFYKPDFLRFLKLFKFNYDYVNITADKDGDLHIHVVGPWLHTILFEVPILSIVSEVYSTDMSMDYTLANSLTMDKIDMIKAAEMTLLFAEFGGRRRHSVKAQDNALLLFRKNCPENLVGTSNLMMAKSHNIKAIGTMAHEWLQAHQALYRVADSQFMALENWAKEYRGDLGIALSDVIGLKYFLHDFDKYFSKLFDGTRQDSGDPHIYANNMIKHYESMGIDPKTKTIVFSDGLTIKKAIEIWELYHNKINVSFGIGTHITNDFDFKALQLVLKMTKCNGQTVAKLSDDPDKGMCTDQGYVDYLRTVFASRVGESPWV